MQLSHQTTFLKIAPKDINLVCDDISSSVNIDGFFRVFRALRAVKKLIKKLN